MSDPFGHNSAKKASKAQQERTELERQRQSLSSARQRRESVRQARAARADLQQAASDQGVATSSAAQGGQGALTSQFTSNLSFLDNQNLMVDQESAALGRQRKYEAKAAQSKAEWGAALNIATFFI